MYTVINVVQIVPQHREVEVMFTSTTVALPLKQRALRGRRLVVVDIENRVGGAVMAAEDAAQVRRCLQEVVGLREDEQVIIGTSHIGAMSTGLGWPGARYLWRSGVNGADLALRDVLTGERIEERFDEVVLASCDGIFTDAVAALGAAGVKVTIVAHRDGCSKRLRMAASHTVFLNNGALGLADAA